METDRSTGPSPTACARSERLVCVRADLDGAVLLCSYRRIGRGSVARGPAYDVGTGPLQFIRDTASQQGRARIRVRFQITRNARIDYVGEYQSCMVSKLPIIWKQTVLRKRVTTTGRRLRPQNIVHGAAAAAATSD